MQVLLELRKTLSNTFQNDQDGHRLVEAFRDLLLKFRGTDSCVHILKVTESVLTLMTPHSVL
jgi:hypothetical protein